MDPFPLFEELFPAEALDEAQVPSRGPEPDVLTVTTFIERCQTALDDHIPFAWVEGEISNLRIPRSGHCYFSLKDDRSQLRAVMFRGQAAGLPFSLEDGLEVVCYGEANIYGARGDLQLVVRRLMPKGEGQLRLALEQLKRRLEREGLFDPAHKKGLPELPERIFLITSPTGAAVRDFIKIARGMGAGGELILCPVKVQGEGAAQEVAQALRLADTLAGPGDVAVITRGGGSLEDLWAFNDEALARVIHRVSIPVVSAVGHEIDVTIADLVADLRAATPTAAAHTVFGERERLLERARRLTLRLQSAAGARLEGKRGRLALLAHRLRSPRELLYQRRLYVDDCLRRLEQGLFLQTVELQRRVGALVQRLGRAAPERRFMEMAERFRVTRAALERAIAHRVETGREGVARLVAILEAESPLAVLARGYSLVTRAADGAIVRSARQVGDGDELLIRPSQGVIRCRVTEREVE